MDNTEIMTIVQLKEYKLLFEHKLLRLTELGNQLNEYFNKFRIMIDWSEKIIWAFDTKFKHAGSNILLTNKGKILYIEFNLSLGTYIPNNIVLINYEIKNHNFDIPSYAICALKMLIKNIEGQYTIYSTNERPKINDNVFNSIYKNINEYLEQLKQEQQAQQAQLKQEQQAQLKQEQQEELKQEQQEELKQEQQEQLKQEELKQEQLKQLQMEQSTQSIKWIYGDGEKEFYYVVTHIDYEKEKNTHTKKYFKNYDEAEDYYKQELEYEEITKQTECMETYVVGGKIYIRKIGVKALTDQICRLLSGNTEEFKVVNVGITYEDDSGR